MRKSADHPKVSETIRVHINEFYAVLASKVAARAAAIAAIADTHAEIARIDMLAITVEQYLVRAGAKATRYRFRLPG